MRSRKAHCTGHVRDGWFPHRRRNRGYPFGHGSRGRRSLHPSLLPYSLIKHLSRPHRTRAPLHRSHSRRSNHPKSQYPSSEEWHHSRVYVGNGTQSTAKRVEGADYIYGILQSTPELWGREGFEGCEGGRCGWVYCRGFTTGRGSEV